MSTIPFLFESTFQIIFFPKKVGIIVHIFLLPDRGISTAGSEKREEKEFMRYSTLRSTILCSYFTSIAVATRFLSDAKLSIVFQTEERSFWQCKVLGKGEYIELELSVVTPFFILNSSGP